MDIARRHLPWKIERQLRDLANQFRRQRLVSAWVRLAFTVAAGLPALALSIHLLSPTRIPLAVPIGVLLLAVGVLWWRWIRPALAEPTREQIALYIDEQHPELENLAVSSLSFSEREQLDASEWLVDRFFEHARVVGSATRVRDLVDHGQWRIMLARLGVAWGLVALIGVFTVGRWDPEWLESQLFTRTTPAPVAFSVEPGDIRVRHGVDQVVWLSTEATSETVAIRWKPETGAWTSSALQPSRSDNVFFHTFTNIQVPILYQVQAAGSQSPVYRIDVWTPPEVAWIDAVYEYPDYTGLPDRSVTAIDALKGPVGARVRLSVHTNQPVTEGRMTFVFGQPVTLQSESANLLVTELEIGAEDTFRVALQDQTGQTYTDERPYAITPEWDEVPDISIRFPRGDDEATPIEEIPFAFMIEDDLGIWSWGLQYEVAGREPIRRTLGRHDQSRTSVEAEDVLALEDLDLKPGDFLIWYVWADDRHPNRTEFDQLSDPFFLEIRPFRRTYAEAVSNAGQQGAGEQQGNAADQKQVIIATWNLRKMVDDLIDGEFDERRAAIVTAQQNVLAAALEGPAASDYAVIQKLQESAGAAIEALNQATWEDAGPRLTEALRHEQMVHQQLLSMEPDEWTLAQGQGSGQGRSGGRRQNRDLDALELTRRRNFAEEATTANERLGRTEEVRKGIEDLAKRQTFINRDLSELVSEQDRQENPEEAERRLQKLIEEQRQNLSELEQMAGDVATEDLGEQTRDARDGLAEAGRRMRQTLRHMEEDNPQRAQSSGSGALRELAEVEEQLGALSRDAAAQRLGALSERMDELAEQQKEILEDIRNQQERPVGPRSIDQATDTPVLEAKEALSDDFEAFMNEAGELAEKAEATQGQASGQLNDWLRETSREGIYEDMERGKDLVRNRIWEASETHERNVLKKLEDARERLEAVTGGLVASDVDGMRRALEQIEGLVSNGSDGAPLSDPTELTEFLDRGYREWVDDLRSAESMLGSDNPVRRDLGGIREDIDRLRRRFRRDKVPPRFDLVYDQVTRPLQLAAEELREEIARETGEYAVGIERLDTVPERYRKQVAEYFKALSEINTPRSQAPPGNVDK